MDVLQGKTLFSQTDGASPSLRATNVTPMKLLYSPTTLVSHFLWVRWIGDVPEYA